MLKLSLPFRDRHEAGEILSEHLFSYADKDDVVVLGLARGGVPVAFEVARALSAPLDVFVVRKLGVPDYPELAMGAIASGGILVLNEEIVKRLTNAKDALAHVISAETRELERRERQYRNGRPTLTVGGKIVILTDDGLATGATMRAAVMALKKRPIVRCVVAVPVGSPETCARLRREADEVVCVASPPSFRAVGQFYENFPQTSDAEVRELLVRAQKLLEADLFQRRCRIWR